MLHKVVIRNLLKHPFLHLVKIIGLSLALSGILFITLFLKNELSYDNYHPNAKNIYRFTIEDPEFLAGKHFARVVNPSYVANFPDEIAGIENFVRMRPVREGLMKYGNRYYNISQAFEVDSTFFNVFEASLLVGDKQNVLENPASLVITKSFAHKLFGNKNPIGEVLVLPAGQFYAEDQSFTIQGIMNDFPLKTHFHPDFIATPVQDKFDYGWAWSYLVLNTIANPAQVEKAIESYLAELWEQNSEEFNTKVNLQKITDIHLQSHKLREIENNGNLRNIYVLAIAAFILLVISISNYANLNIGMSGFSAKYLFINKLLGSSRRSVIRYFFYEGILILFGTIVLTLIISVPVNFVIKRFYNLNLLHDNYSTLALLIFSFSMLSLIFGMLPVLKSVFGSLSIRQNSNTSVTIGKGGINRGLIVFQYAFSIALIIAVIVISRQTNYAFKNSLGVQEENIVVFESVHASIQQRFETFKQELLKYNSIQSVSAMMEPPGGEANDMFEFELEGYTPDESDEQYERIGVFPCDYSFASIFNLEFIGGQNFSEKNVDNEGSGEYIINESAMRRLNHSNPEEIVGKFFKLNFSVPGTGITIPKGKIIGVVKDFHLSSMKKQVEPLVLFKRDNLWLINFVVAIQPGMQEQALTDMEKVWTSLFPEYPFQYEHVDAMYQKVYKAERLQAGLLSVFTVIALFICSIGLFALALIVTQNRVKEIGIRKVNGARVAEILSMLNKDFMKWVIIAFVIACPAAWYAMDKWLENFAYKTSLSWWIFVLAGILALGIALFTVSWQSWRAATQNPVEALRYE